MKRLFLLCLAAALAAVACAKRQQAPKPLYMWFDCEANYARLSHPDSIRHYVSRLHDMGFTDLVVDVKSIMGETLYKERHSPLYGRMGGRDAPRGLRHAGPLHRGRPQTGHAGPRLAQRLRRRPQLLRPRHHLRRTRRLAVAGLHRGPHRADQPDQEQLQRHAQPGEPRSARIRAWPS